MTCPDLGIRVAISVWKENGRQDLFLKLLVNYGSLVRRHIENPIGKRQIAVTATGVFDLEGYFRFLANNGLRISEISQVQAIIH